MTELQLSRRLAQILVYGHVLLFFYGGLVWLFGQFKGDDAAQLMLMGSPILAAVGIAAFSFIIQGGVTDTSQPAERVQIQMTQLICYAFLFALFAVYTTAFVQTGLKIDTIKLIVGIIETALGGYIGLVRDKFFPAPPKPPVPGAGNV